MDTSKKAVSRTFFSVLRFFKTPFGILLIVAILWQFTYTVIGVTFSSEQGILSHMSHWDAGWYQHIIQYSYSNDGNPAAPAFYPLFPLLVSLLNAFSFGFISLEASALLINTLALWLILIGLWRILTHFNAGNIGKIAALTALLTFPSSFFLHVFYSEAVFIAIAVWSYFFAITRKWWAMGLLLGVLTAARLPSLLFVGLCGLEYLRAYRWKINKALNKKALWFLIAPFGFIAYGSYLYITRGNFLAMFHAYSATSDWAYQVFSLNIFATLFETIRHTVTADLNYELFINYLLPLGSLAFILASSIYILRKLGSKGVPLFIFGIVSIIFFTLNSNIVSVHRYALACLVIYIAIALFVQKGWKFILTYTALILLLAIQLFIFAKFIQDIFAG